MRIIHVICIGGKHFGMSQEAMDISMRSRPPFMQHLPLSLDGMPATVLDDLPAHQYSREIVGRDIIKGWTLEEWVVVLTRLKWAPAAVEWVTAEEAGRKQATALVHTGSPPRTSIHNAPTRNAPVYNASAHAAKKEEES